MASSSHNTFEGEGVDDETFDQYFDQYFDQTFENLSIECDREVGRKKKKTSPYRTES